MKQKEKSRECLKPSNESICKRNSVQYEIKQDERELKTVLKTCTSLLILRSTVQIELGCEILIKTREITACFCADWNHPLERKNIIILERETGENYEKMTLSRDLVLCYSKHGP